MGYVSLPEGKYGIVHAIPQYLGRYDGDMTHDH